MAIDGDDLKSVLPVDIKRPDELQRWLMHESPFIVW